MLHRRQFLSAAAAGTALLTPFAGFAQSTGPIRFGTIADPQYGDLRRKSGRNYRLTLEKLPVALQTLNAVPDLDFVVTLGDIIERHWESYLTLLPLYNALKHDHFFLLGNHDYQVAPEYLDRVHEITGITEAYYTFAAPGHRFIVIDGNDVSVLRHRPGTQRHEEARERMAAMAARGEIHGLKRNGAISDEQFAWIAAELVAAQAAGERVIAMSHYPLYPLGDFNMWDDARLVELFSSFDHVILYICGHYHKGNYARVGRTHYVNFRAMVQTRNQNAFATVEVGDDRIDITGYGKQESMTLAI